jgi:hypothetical protein
MGVGVLGCSESFAPPISEDAGLWGVGVLGCWVLGVVPRPVDALRAVGR